MIFERKNSTLMTHETDDTEPHRNKVAPPPPSFQNSLTFDEILRHATLTDQPSTSTQSSLDAYNREYGSYHLIDLGDAREK